MDIFYSTIKVFSALAFLVGLIFILLYIIKNYWGRRLGLPSKEGFIKILARTYLGAKKEIAVIETGSDILVVGITEDRISLLTKLEGDVFRGQGEGGRVQERI
ncbi:MAG: flagellar biosynthetic protein FliO [Nitrospirota bacterium]